MSLTAAAENITLKTKSNIGQIKNCKCDAIFQSSSQSWIYPSTAPCTTHIFNDFSELNKKGVQNMKK